MHLHSTEKGEEVVADQVCLDAPPGDDTSETCIGHLARHAQSQDKMAAAIREYVCHTPEMNVRSQTYSQICDDKVRMQHVHMQAEQCFAQSGDTVRALLATTCTHTDGTNGSGRSPVHKLAAKPLAAGSGAQEHAWDP